MTEKSPDIFLARLDKQGVRVEAGVIETLWVNITRLCNQSCRHCHVGASPQRTEMMDRSTMDACLSVLASNSSIINLDITGGAPELHPDFKYFVAEARKLGKKVIVRHNLTVTLDGNPVTGEKMDYLPEFFAENEVEIIASLPHYRQEIADDQRGGGIFEKSLEGLKRLNKVGYGDEATGLVINLMHNADGPVSPADRERLEQEYRGELEGRYGLRFNRLYAVSNAPIGRQAGRLDSAGEYDEYCNRLVAAFSPDVLPKLVCRTLVSVGHDGRLYDCDFNQMLDLPVLTDIPMTIFNFDYRKLVNRKIRFGRHCYGCTAGGGGS